MSVIGYLLISMLLLLLIALLIRIFTDLSGNQPENVPLGPLAKETSDIILNNIRKFVTIQEDSTLSYVSVAIIFVLIVVIKMFLT